LVKELYLKIKNFYCCTVNMPEKINAKVSIGMSVFNGEKRIRKAIESLLSQTHGDFELIISDNVSTIQRL